MGMFSWLDCKSGKQVLVNEFEDVYLLIPHEFGGGHVLETCYDGYGRFAYHDVYELVALWNAPDKCNGNYNHDRNLGIMLACYDEDNMKLKYPIKITHDATAVYEDCNYSPSDPDQGFKEDEEDEEDEEEIYLSGLSLAP